MEKASASTKEQNNRRRLTLTTKVKKNRLSWRQAIINKFPLNFFMIRLYLLISLSLILVFLALPSSFPREITFEIGEIADRNIKAERDLMILDQASTQEKIDAAVRNASLVFDLDDEASLKARELVRDIFIEGRSLLRLSSEKEDEKTGLIPSRVDKTKGRLKERFNTTFGFSETDPAFNTMLQLGFPEEAEAVVAQLVTEVLDKGVLDDASMRPGEDARVTVRKTTLKEESVAPLGHFPELKQARKEIMERALVLRGDFKAWQAKIMGTMAQALIQPNVKLNRAESEARKKKAVAAVAPVYYHVKQGEMIVREGEKVDLEERLKLEAMARSGAELTAIIKLVGLFLLSVVFILAIFTSGSKIFPQIGQLKDRDMIFLSLLLIMTLVLATIVSNAAQAMVRGGVGLEETTVLYLAPIAAMGMVVTIFLGSAPGFMFAIASSILTGLLLNSFSLSIYYFIGTIVGSAGVSRVKERNAPIRSGLLVALTNVVTLVGLSFYTDSIMGGENLWNIGAGLLNGILAGIIVTGFIPLFEMLFQYTTDVKLLELANLDRPVLRELLVQAPGTYHHSVIVGAMVEAASEAIGANHLLAKVSAYYHDIGKLKKPLYFVENQGGGENKHEKLSPSMSSLILISHVKDGVELARQNKLGKDIINIIKEHHGTSVIAYFYQKARDGKGEAQPEINIDDYRYPGPKPQTKEAGLVMLADAVEAASRTLVDPTPARIQGLVQKIINNFFSDGQLDECELTLKDLHLIASTFNRILTGIYHRRIEYPEAPLKEPDKRLSATNGHRNHKSANGGADKEVPAKGTGKENLKRLGIS